VVSLGEGMTPLLPMPRLDSELGLIPAGGKYATTDRAEAEEHKGEGNSSPRSFMALPADHAHRDVQGTRRGRRRFQLGWIGSRLPRLVAVQAAGCLHR
jgi:hypothetical protein